jgi:hypothetical protein
VSQPAVHERAVKHVIASDRPAMAFRLATDGSSIRLAGQAEMSANDQQEAFEKLLRSYRARLFDLVRFAETRLR